MQSLVLFLWCSFMFLVFLVSLASSEENNRSVCVLSDAPNQCGQFCLSKLHPMLNMIPETDVKLDRIQEEQQAIQTRLQAVQFWLQVQWTIIKGSLKEITPEVFEARLNETEKQLLALISETKNQFNLVQKSINDQSSVVQLQIDAKLLEVQTKLDDQSKVIQESCKNATGQGDFEAILQRIGGQLEELKSQLQLLQTNIGNQIEEVKSVMEGQFQAVQSRLEGQQKTFEGALKTVVTKDDFEAGLQEVLAKMEKHQAAFQEILTKINVKTVPPMFEKIGERYFHIENNYKLNWISAAATCRKMGGYLASIRDHQELNALLAKLRGVYWTGTNDRENEGHFVSEASGKTPFLKWRPGEPNDFRGNEDCVEIIEEVMNDTDCAKASFFICQADNEV
ncbi:CD209 antigen-like protein B [Drosophila biarmipes]|uniref:CD209 antigen-like protein B n=1 Tax=Drosophila biarmipes TaxID=125945 RepID=UPI0007E7B37B|nr:CD209 antigen-like protein B [Drosophila biarmipes]